MDIKPSVLNKAISNRTQIKTQEARQEFEDVEQVLTTVGKKLFNELC